MQYPIENDCIYVSIDGNPKKQLMSELLFQVYVRELHNILMITPGEFGMKEARDEKNNIIISDSTLRNILPSQQKNTTLQYKVMYVCVCECCISAKTMNSSLLSWRDCF